MGTAIAFAVIASAALPIGAWIGAWHPPKDYLTSALMAFASGALITAVAFELFEDAFEGGGAWRAGIAFLLGAAVFIAIDTPLERKNHENKEGMKTGAVAAGGAVGFALLAGVTLDGIPENLAMGVGLIDSASPTLLVAIFASNLPEAMVGAKKMSEAKLSRGRILGIWTGAAVLLAIPVVLGYGLLEGIPSTTLAWPLGFAAGAVLASLADTLMPEAFDESKRRPSIAFFTALGFLVSFFISSL
ncbi:zinc permease [Thermoleophilia bacterium SCSIO 60948]|nr:zinc permease [Thermoleophilia bacterium SCSIO 60948]